ncbi:hypothetical protein LJD47_26970, partial [Escherichia coli]|nr:hypothetical protein [Escherichia coli]
SDDLATPSLINWLASIRISGSVSPEDYHAAFALLGVDVAGQTAASLSDAFKAELDAKISERLSLLAAKSFAEADRIRNELL